MSHPNPPRRKNGEPISLGDALPDVVLEMKARQRRTGPVGMTMSIPLSDYSETTLGDLRDLLAVAAPLPDTDAVHVYVPLDPREHGTISIIAGCEARA